VLDHPRIALRAIGERPCQGALWQELRLPGAAHSDRLDVFFSPAYSCPLRLRVPRVTAVHDLSFFSWPQDFAWLDAARRRLLTGASIGASARIVTISDFSRREILARFPDATSRVVAIPVGCDDDLPAPPSREEALGRLAAPGPCVLAVGSILSRRRLPTLLDALRLLRRLEPAPLLDVVGENRTHPRLELPALVAARGLGSRVRLAGFVSEARLADHYAAADAFVFLSEYEGFGLPVLEAMARGVAVVTSARPATGEIFGDAALLVDPADPVAIAAALRSILEDRARRDDLVARGRRLASRFSWKDAAARTMDALRGAAAS
jgi:glycosyltransferase involved in cell wall biosynthesis